MNGSTFDEGTSPGDVKNFNGKALLRVRDAKPNTDAEHRVPTASRLYEQRILSQLPSSARLGGEGHQDEIEFFRPRWIG